MDDKFDFSTLLPPCWKKQVQEWLANDTPSFDVGGFVVGDEKKCAHLLGKSLGVLAGVPFFNAVFEAVDCQVEWKLTEGQLVDPASGDNGKVLVAIVTGSCRNILLGERTALNILARASGIASRAREMAKLVRGHGWKGEVAGTRKTTPGFRIVEKYALLVGGASTHRHDLSQMVMLKDNHIWASGSITNAVRKAKAACGFSMKIEVECRSLEEAKEAAQAGADIVMLDNYEPEDLKVDAKALKQSFPHVLVEASGGITKDTIVSYLSEYVDVVSQGAMTQGYGFVDFSLKIQK